jgi:predicted small metal-binding protein
MTRTVFDCARVPGDTCSLQMIGEKNEVVPAAKEHLISAHGHKDGPQLNQNVTKVVEDHATTYSTWI